MPESDAPPLHVPTLAALAVVAGAVDTLTHEAVGHGGVCLAVGGWWGQVSSAHLRCEGFDTVSWLTRAVDAGGTLDNLVIALLALLALRLGSLRGTGRAFAWLLFAMNGLAAGGYLMTSPLFGFGDWEAFVTDLSPAWPWRIGLSAIGLAISVAVLRAAVREVEPFLGDGPDRSRRAWTMVAPTWAADVALSAAGGALNPEGLLVMSMVASALGHCWMLWLPAWIRPATGSASPEGVPASVPWLVAAVVVAIVFVVGFGPGLPRS